MLSDNCPVNKITGISFQKNKFKRATIMKLQKSILALAIAATLSASVFILPALAADNTQASTQFTYTKQNDPTYTVSIPSSLSLTDEGTPLTITASDVAYLNGKKVSVTIAGTNYYRNQLVLSAKTSKPTYTDTIRYQLIGPSNLKYNLMMF